MSRRKRLRALPLPGPARRCARARGALPATGGRSAAAKSGARLGPRPARHCPTGASRKARREEPRRPARPPRFRRQDTPHPARPRSEPEGTRGRGARGRRGPRALSEVGARTPGFRFANTTSPQRALLALGGAGRPRDPSALRRPVPGSGAARGRARSGKTWGRAPVASGVDPERDPILTQLQNASSSTSSTPAASKLGPGEISPLWPRARRNEDQLRQEILGSVRSSRKTNLAGQSYPPFTLKGSFCTRYCLKEITVI